MTKITPARLDVIRERLAGLPPGPWTSAPQRGPWGHCDAAQVFDAEGRNVTALDGRVGDDDHASRLAAFLAASRQDVPDLIAEVGDLRADNQRLFDEISKRFDLEDVIEELSKPTTITVTLIGETFMADDKTQTGMPPVGYGKTVAEAVGNFILNNKGRLGIRVVFGDEEAARAHREHMVAAIEDERTGR